MRNAPGLLHSHFSSPEKTILLTIPFCSESKHYESDTEAVVDPKLAMYRLHEGVSHASRASDVGELHRLQKSSTKPRHDGEFDLIDDDDDGREARKKQRERLAPPFPKCHRRFAMGSNRARPVRPPRHARDGRSCEATGKREWFEAGNVEDKGRHWFFNARGDETNILERRRKKEATEKKT